MPVTFTTPTITFLAKIPVKAGFKSLCQPQKNIIYSSFQVAFAVDGEFREIDDTLYFDCDTIDVGMSKHNRLCVKITATMETTLLPQAKP